MEHERGAFKVNREIGLRAVKIGARKGSLGPVGRSFGRFHARELVPQI